MYREAIVKLQNWKNSAHRKPLIVRGARQVGKTWLMQEFGKSNYKKCAYISMDENERMEKNSVSREFTLTVEEKYDPYQEMMDNTQVPVEDGPNYTVIIIVVAVVIVALVVAVVVGVKVRKKKKAGKGSDEFDEEI